MHHKFSGVARWISHSCKLTALSPTNILALLSITHTHSHIHLSQLSQGSDSHPQKQSSHSLNHLQVVQQVRRPLSLGRYQPPTRSCCIPSTGRSELSDRSAKQSDLHVAHSRAYSLFISVALREASPDWFGIPERYVCEGSRSSRSS